MIDLLLLRQAIVLIGTLAASYTDIKTGLIYDKITYPMIALGIILNLIEFELTPLTIPLTQISFALPLGFVIPIIVFLIFAALYYSGKMGGGDVKLFTGIALLIPLFDGTLFIANVLFFAAILSIVFHSAYYSIKYLRSGPDLNENKQSIIRAIIFMAFFILFFSFSLIRGVLRIESVLFLSLPIALGLLYMALQKGIQTRFFLKHIKLSELEEDEIIASDYLNKEILAKLSLGPKGVLGEREIEKLKDLNVSEVPVLRSLPIFGPFIFLGVLLSLFFPHFFLWLYF